MSQNVSKITEEEFKNFSRTLCLYVHFRECVPNLVFMITLLTALGSVLVRFLIQSRMSTIPDFSITFDYLLFIYLAVENKSKEGRVII